MERSEVEQQLGAQMHLICLQQELVVAAQKELKTLQDAANELDQQLKDLDNIK